MKRKTVAITGYEGFIGSALLSCENPSLLFAPVSDSAGPIDIHDSQKLSFYFQSVKPDIILHLAAQSNIPRSFSDPCATYKDNFLGVANILNILESKQFNGKFIFASTAHVYGHIDKKDLPVRESQAKNPLSPYGLSKLCAEELLMMQSRLHAFKAIIVRPFNITGPNQSDQFVLPALARQVVEVSLGQKECIEVGNLDVSRDFLDVRDATEAFISLCKSDCPSGAYNLCSGRAYSLRDLLGKMMDLANVKAAIVVDKARFRPSDQPILVGCNDKLQKETGWGCHTPIEQTLTEIMNYWRDKLCQTSAL